MSFNEISVLREMNIPSGLDNQTVFTMEGEKGTTPLCNQIKLRDDF